jgi:(p)ppGpp synthase/HD superfamily hydrolase
MNKDQLLTEKLQTAWLLAAHHHEGQRYKTPVEGVTLPYLTHLGAVLIEAQSALRHEPGLDPELMQLCAILHDTLEDTDLDAATIRDHFGDRVLAGVRALAKNENLPTKWEQMEDSLTRILAQPPEIAAVKLCDRINNLSPPPHYWTTEKVATYRAEAGLILERLGGASAYLAERLRTKIAGYGIA